MRLLISFFLLALTSSGFCQQTIQKMIDAAQKHDTIIVKENVYKEHNITITKPITIIGKKNVVIDAEAKGYVFKVLADSVTIKNISAKNVGKSYTKDFAAIYISRSDHITIEDVTLTNVFFGLLIEKSKNIRIRNNYISSKATTEAGTGNGIHLWHCSNAEIEQNELHSLRDGIYFEFVKNSVVKNNHSHHNLRYGLHFMFSNNNEYLQNTFNNNGAGVAVMFSKYIKMTRNKFLKNWGTASYGLLLKEIYDAEIIHNEFSENTIAINLEGATRINYVNNTFSNNGWALKVAGACYKNVFKKNNFLNNSFDVSYNSKLNDNSFKGNYWSSYTGYDLDKNGIGDVPYRPVKLFSYIVNKTPEAIILLRSLFVDIINFSEKVTPVFTPKNLVDEAPLMQKVL
ncbi:nitrous oxide reductase family maturation protein NosD [Tenacibaculum singaporense]|uniref:nitrous oxide reductase family maturation protein NosD n=1 Tax=Tenacibaculum singaporense TaxID=2358479 RepID=UPI000F690E44|nr:nitrous oxide reductase family maturation protein NosD [Tenacibaculum singaporense]RSC94797.1 nitrous oxide reductase family maturation protein NosD [Tenacibaculum singaporense]